MRILITGAAGAIGAATAQGLARAGHEVVATARDPARLAGLAVSLRLPLDVSDDDSVRRAVDRAGELDAVVNNAAQSGKGPLESFPLDRIRTMLDTNTLGPLRLLQPLLPAWRARGRGVVVNISSVQGRVAVPLEGPYSMSKFGLEALSETLHHELGHFGIRVVVVQPGYIAPGMKQVDAVPGAAVYRPLWEEWSGTDRKLTGPNGRPGPELVAAAVRAAIEDPATPFRVLVGDDARLVLRARSRLDDAAFEAAMRATLDLTW